MTVQQTSQLIQLILNSALMIAVCVSLWGGLWLRCTTLADRLKALHLDYVKLSHALPTEARGEQRDRAQSLKQQRHHLQSRYRMAKRCNLIVHYALMGFMGNIFALAARTLVQINGLIYIALVLFTGGTALLLLSVSLALFDLQRGQSRRQGGQSPLSQTRSTPRMSWLQRLIPHGGLGLRRKSRSRPSRQRMPPLLPPPGGTQTPASGPGVSAPAYALSERQDYGTQNWR